MIYSVTSDKPSFKNIIFKLGFNVVLAERTKESTIKDSRNGLGKSTLIEIVHFCLGSGKGETLTKKEMDDWSFTLVLDISGKKYSITRNTTEQNKIFIDGDCSGWPIPPHKDPKSEKQILPSIDWTRTLGILMFDLETSYGDMKYVPTYKSLKSYFIRRNGQRGGFLNPFQQFQKQLEWDMQLNNAYLLGLGWEYASKWQVLKDRKKVLGQIKQEAQSGLLANIMGSVGELEAKKIQLEAQIKREDDQLKNFRVHPQYSRLETDSNQLTMQIHDLVNANVSDRMLLAQYESTLVDEVEADPKMVKNVYEEAGFVLESSLLKKLDDILEFHKQVVKNRRDFLRTEIGRIKDKIAKREQQKADLSSKKAESMLVLQRHGALDEYTQLQNNHQKEVAELEDLKIRIDNLKKFEQGQSALVVEQELLQQEALSDLNERQNQKEKATLLFNENSQALYDAPGILSIDIEKTGYKYKVVIERSGSHGIGNMKIFCYDLMLAQIWSEKRRNLGFLIHDSLLFADVDERQKALALQLAASESEKWGFQYICTLNSDSIPKHDFGDSFNLNSYVVTTLTDNTDEGGLLGVRF